MDSGIFKIQAPRPHPRPTKSESAFKQDLQVFCVVRKVQEALLSNLSAYLLSHLKLSTQCSWIASTLLHEAKKRLH